MENTSTTKVTINPDGTLQISSPNPNAASTLGAPVSPAQKISLIDRATNPTINLLIGLFGSSLNPPDPLIVYGLQGGSLSTTPLTVIWTSPAWGPGSSTLTPRIEDGNLVAIEFTFSVGTGAQGNVNVSGDYFYAAAQVQAPVILSFTGEFPMPNGGTYSVNYTTDIPSYGGNYLYTNEITYRAPDGSSYTQYQAGDATFGSPGHATGTISGQTSSVTDVDNNTATVACTFNSSTGGFTLRIRDEDAARDGTLEIIEGDSQGNVIGVTTYVISGGVVGPGGDDDDDDDDDGDDAAGGP